MMQYMLGLKDSNSYRPLDPHFLHPRCQGSWLDSEQLCRAIIAGELPFRLFQSRKNVLALSATHFVVGDDCQFRSRWRLASLAISCDKVSSQKISYYISGR